MQEAPDRALGDLGAAERTTNCRKEKGKSLGERSCSKIGGVLPGAGSSKTVVINSQPQFAPSQLDEERKVLVSKPKECKQGILKKNVDSCISKPVEEGISLFHSKKGNGALKEEWSISSSVEWAKQVQRIGSDALAGMFSDIEGGEDQNNAGSGYEGDALADGEMKEQENGLEIDDVCVENKVSAEEEEEEEVDALADMFSDYEGQGQNNSELGMDTQ